jgi:hypothetical protein
MLVCCTAGTADSVSTTSEATATIADASTADASASATVADADTNEPVSAAAKQRHVLATRAADFARSTLVIKRASGRSVVSAYAIGGDGSNGAPGTIQPGVGLWEERSDRISADRQINMPPNGDFTTAVSNAGHDAPGIAVLADGSVIVPYGAASTYPNYHPPASWSCETRIYCEPFKFAPASGDSDLTSDLAQSPQYLLPAVGISEPTSATLGDATIIAGQQQTLSRYGQTGAQGYVTLHASHGRATFDTASGPWDFRAERSPSADGMQMVTRAPNDDAYVDFGIQSASGQGTISLELDGTPCVQNVGGSTPADVAMQFANLARASCPAFRGRFGISSVQYDPLQRGAPGIVGITYSRGDVTTLPGVASVRVQCSGGIVCGAPLDVRASGLHRHFMWGGVMRLGKNVYDILDVQQVTGSWNGPGHNSYALALVCFRSDGPRNGSWQWTDCSGRHAFSESPGTMPVNRLGAGNSYVIPPPARYEENMTPYIYDWSMNAQPPVGSRTYPVISSEGAALDGKDLVIVHACQLRDGNYGICYVRYDTNEGRTVRAGVVDAPPGGGSLAAVAVTVDARRQLAVAALAGNGPKWGCSAAGPCALTYAYDPASGRWVRRNVDPLGGPANAGFAGTVRAEGAGFLFALREPVSKDMRRIVTFEREAP